ncbi:MAG: hypothetical protein ACKVUS_00610 [Saprospiraceae bacterium]
MVFDPSHIGQTILTRIRDQVTGNLCWGQVQVVEAPPLLDTIQLQLCARYWGGDRPIKGATLTFQPINPSFPYLPLVFALDTSQSCADVTVILSDYLPGTTFGYSASPLPDTSPLNGVSVVDLCKISQHILGINPLPSYGKVAADANGSGSVTTFDIIELRKLLLGIYAELPNSNVWRFIADYCDVSNSNCPSGINSTELAALDGGIAKVIGIKTGDVDGDARLPGEPFVPPTATDSLTLLLPEGLVLAGVPVTVPVKLDKDLLLGGLQIHFSLDPAGAQYDSISDGVIDVLPSTVSYNVLTGGLHFLSLGYQSLFVPAGQPLFYIHLKASQNVDLKDILKVVTDDPDAQAFAMGNDCGLYYKIGATYSGSVPAHSPELRGLRVQPPSPNPFGEQTFLEIEMESTETAFLEVLDLTGRIVFSEEKNLAVGAHRWEIPASAIAPGSLGIWRLRVGEQAVAGKLARY